MFTPSPIEFTPAVGPAARPVVARALGVLFAVVRLARSLDLDLVVEGIETPGPLHTLRALGCRFMPGFLFARPMAIDAVRAWLADQQDASAAA